MIAPAPVGGGERAQIPEGDVAGLGIARDVGQEPGAGSTDGIDSDPGQQQREHVHLAERRRNPVDQHRGGKSARKGHHRHRGRAERRGERHRGVPAEHEDECGAECRAGRRPGKSRFDDRIAEQPLHQGAGDAEHGAGDAAEQDSRQSELQEDVAVERVGGGARLQVERLRHEAHHLSDRKHEVADACRRHHRAGQRQHQHQMELAVAQSPQHFTGAPSAPARVPPPACADRST